MGKQAEGGGKRVGRIVRVRTWTLAMEKRPLESRFRRRERDHGPLVLVSRADLLRLIERAETVSRQLELPFTLEVKEGR